MVQKKIQLLPLIKKIYAGVVAKKVEKEKKGRILPPMPFVRICFPDKAKSIRRGLRHSRNLLLTTKRLSRNPKKKAVS